MEKNHQNQRCRSDTGYQIGESLFLEEEMNYNRTDSEIKPDEGSFKDKSTEDHSSRHPGGVVYGMKPSEYNEIMIFLIGREGRRIYPERMRGGSSYARFYGLSNVKERNRKKEQRRSFLRKCTESYKVQGGFLMKKVRSGMHVVNKKMDRSGMYVD